MAPEFSDPEWWPKPPPKPPIPTSVPKLIVGTLLPMLGIAAVVVLIVTHGTGSSAASGRSVAAFEACLGTRGVTAGDQGPDAQRAARTCQANLPAGTPTPSSGGSEKGSRQQRFDDCVRSAVADTQRRRGSRFAGRQAVANAVAVCQTLFEPGLAPRTPTAPSTASPA